MPPLGFSFGIGFIRPGMIASTSAEEALADFLESAASFINPFALVTMGLTQGTERAAEFLVRQKTYYFKPNVIAFGSVERNLSGPPPTLPIINGGDLDIADHDRYWRNLLATTTQRNRGVEIKIGFEGRSEQSFPVAYSGLLAQAKFPPGLMRLSMRDRWKRWMTRRIPGWINRLNYPNLPDGVESGFFPIVFGRVFSTSANPQGQIELPLVDTITHDYAACRGPIQEIIVYRQLPGAEVFSVVSSSEYTIVELIEEFENYPDFHNTYVRFTAAQPDGTKIRADIDGINFRGQFADMPPISGQTIDNAVDFLINLEYFLFILEGTTVPFDGDSFRTTWQKLEDLNLQFAGAFTEDITFGEAISQICASALLWHYPDRYGRLAVNFVFETDPDRIIYDDDFDILRTGRLRGDESELPIDIEDVEKTVNQYEYHFAWTPAEQQFSAAEFYNNAPDQAELGEIEPGDSPYQFYFVRDPAVMLYIIQLFSGFTSLRTKIVRFYLSGPKAVANVELTDLVGLKYYAGYGGPWTNQEVFVIGLKYDLKRHDLLVTATTLGGAAPFALLNPCPEALTVGEKTFSITVT